MSSRNISVTWSVALQLQLILLLAVGCGPSYSGPTTVPAKGKLVFTDGGEVASLADRQVAVVFNSISEPEVLAYGEIKPDGTFELSTVKDRLSTEGAVPGEHRVRLQLDDGSERFIAPKYGKFETSGLTAHVTGEDEIGLSVQR